MKSLRTLLVNLPFIIMAVWLGACSSGGGDGGGIASTVKTTENWYGPARLQQCDEDIDMVGMFPAINFVENIAFTAAKAKFERTQNFDSGGVLTSETLALVTITYDGAVFFDRTDSNPDNDVYAPTAISVVNPPASGNLLHLEFGNVPTVTVGPPDTSLTYTDVPVVEGGGIVMSNDGTNRPHAFLYIHDKLGCDLVIAAIQMAQQGETGDEPLPVYSEADFFDTAWSGISEEFLDGPYEPTADDNFPIVISWIDEPVWQLNVGLSTTTDVSGTGSYNKAAVTFTGGYIMLEDSHGFFRGMLFTNTEEDWTILGFLTPDKAYFGGFAWKNPWPEFDALWHDLSLVKQ